MREPLEKREVCQRRNQASHQNDLQAADLVGQPAEDNEERRPEHQRRPDQRVRRHAVDFERDQQEEQRVELARVPHHALARGGAQECQQHVLVIRIPEEAVGERRLRALALGLHPLEYRRLVEPQADVDREDQQDQRDQERQPPAPVGKLRGCEPAGEAAKSDNDQREEEPERRSRLDPRCIIAALPFRRMLGHVSCGAAVFAAEREALEKP